MKKYIIGAIAGLMLSIGVSAHAEVISMIGKTIDGSFPIKINGKTLTNQAVTIEGTSYVPTREFAESLGAEVKFNADLGIEVMPLATPTPLPVVDARKEKIKELRKQSDELTKKIVELAPIVNEYELADTSTTPPTMKERDERYYAAKKQREDLAAQRDEIDAQIKALQQ